MNFTAEQEYPDLSQHNNHMAKVLSLEMYSSLRDKQTPSGFTLDDVIQTGVDNPGKRPVFKMPVYPCFNRRLGAGWPNIKGFDLQIWVLRLLVHMC